MAQLPPPSLLLGRRQGGKYRSGKQGAAPGSPHDQRPDPPAGGEPGREALRAQRATPDAHGSRPRRVPLRRRDLLAGTRAHRYSQGTCERKTAAADRPRRRRPPPIVGAAGFSANWPPNGWVGVIAEGPAGPGIPIRAFSHLLGECGTTFFAAARLAASIRRKFPRSLDGTPFLLPGAPSAVRRALEQWFNSQDIHPRVVGEFDDSALAKDFGTEGMGIFAAPTVIEAEVRKQYRVRVVGRSDAVRQQFYAISVERKIRHPAVAAVCEAARKDLFVG